jgi:hypothetical protein
MNYIKLINDFWTSHELHSFRTNEIALFFYLVKINNQLSWKESFERNNRKIMADLDVSFPTLKNARNRLKQAGVLDFKTVKGSAKVSYTFKKFFKVTNKVTNEVTNEVTVEVTNDLNKTKTKLNNITTTTRAHTHTCANAPQSEVVVVFEKWNKTKNLIHVTENKALFNDIQLLLKEFDIGTIEKAIEYCDMTPSLNGSGKSNFRAMLSWFVKKENFTRIVDSVSAPKFVTDEDRRAVAERKRLIVDDLNKLYSEKMNNIKVKIHKEFDFKEVDILNRRPLTAEEQKQEDEKYTLFNEKVEQTINEQNKRLNEKLATMRSWLHNKMTTEQGENYNSDEYDFRELEEQRKIINCFGKL